MLISSSACDFSGSGSGETKADTTSEQTSSKTDVDDEDEDEDKNDSTDDKTEGSGANDSESETNKISDSESDSKELDVTEPEETNFEATESENTEVVTTESTETESHETETEIKVPNYQLVTVNGGTNMQNILKTATIIKANSPYACVSGIREKHFVSDALPFDDGEQILIPKRFLCEVLKLSFQSSTDTGSIYASPDEIYKAGASVFYDQDLGIAVLTVEKKLKFSDGDVAAEFTRAASNMLVAGLETPTAKMQGDRPVIFETDEMLDYSKEMANKGIEPYASSLKHIINKAEYALAIGPKPYYEVSCQDYRFAACDDFVHARYLALAYYNTRDRKYLDAAVSFLKTYSESSPMLGTSIDTSGHLDYSNPKINGKSDIGLNIGLPLTAACEAYSIIYPYVDEADRASIENWIRIEAELVIEGHEYWIVNDYYDKQYGNNHLTCHLMAIIAAAYTLEDDDLLSYALEGSDTNPKFFSEMIESAILMYGDDVWLGTPGDIDDRFAEGEIYDRYRVVQNKGFGYSLYHLKFLTNCATVLYNNGIDYFIFYGEGGENLLLPFKTYSEYILDFDKITDAEGIIKSGHYAGSPLNLTDAYSLYILGYYHYKDEDIAEVIKFLAERGVKIEDIELFGGSTAYIYGTFIPE